MAIKQKKIELPAQECLRISEDIIKNLGDPLGDDRQEIAELNAQLLPELRFQVRNPQASPQAVAWMARISYLKTGQDHNGTAQLLKQYCEPLLLEVRRLALEIDAVHRRTKAAIKAHTEKCVRATKLFPDDHTEYIAAFSKPIWENTQYETANSSMNSLQDFQQYWTPAETIEHAREVVGFYKKFTIRIGEVKMYEQELGVKLK